MRITREHDKFDEIEGGDFVMRGSDNFNVKYGKIVKKNSWI